MAKLVYLLRPMRLRIGLLVVMLINALIYVYIILRCSMLVSSLFIYEVSIQFIYLASSYASSGTDLFYPEVDRTSNTITEKCDARGN
jgi:hypothetical protein